MGWSGSGVAVSSNQDILYLHRAGYPFNNEEIIPLPTIMRIDAETLEVIDTWGENLFKSPHGLAVDASDNIWITDVMQNRVYKFSPDGELLQTFGEDYPFYMETCLRIRNELPNLPCTASRPSLFARPTDVAVMPNGDFVVSDGYRNSRIARFSAEGDLLWEVSGLGNDNGEFFLPHGIAINSNGIIYIADRKNARIQVFSPDGTWLNTWDSPELGRPFGIDVAADQTIYVVDGGDQLDIPNSQPRSQVVHLDRNGNILNRWGQYGSEPEEMQVPHDIAVSNDGQIYVAEIDGERMQVFILSSRY
jgi:DNA-binding beta-propeller fold protein YncE